MSTGETMDTKAAEVLEMLSRLGVPEERARELLKQVLNSPVTPAEWEFACTEYFRNREEARG